MSVGLAMPDILPFSRASNPASIRAELSPFALVLLASAGIRLLWWSFALPPFVMPDSVGYFVPGFVLLESGQLQLDLRRTPGYPLFTAGVLAVFGRDSLHPLLAVQHAIGWSTAGLTYLLGRLLFGRPTALLAGLLIGVDGALLLSEQLIMTETLFALWLIVSCVLLVLGMKCQQPVLLSLSGLALGVLTLVRPTGHILVLSPLLACLLASRPRGWLNAALVVGGFALIVTPWTARNWVQFGTPSIAGSGRFLMERGLKYDDVFLLWSASVKITESDPFRRAAISILLEEDREWWPTRTALRLRRELRLSEAESDSLMRELSLAAISANPMHYLKTTAWMAYQIVANRALNVSDYWRSYEEVGWPSSLRFLLPDPSQNRFPAAQTLVALVDPGRFGLLAGLLFCIGAAAAWRKPESRLWLAPASMVLLGIGSTAAIGGMEWRYRFPFDPLLLLGAVAGAMALLRTACSWIRRLGTARRDAYAESRPSSLPR
jgi:hypothetical protein